MLQRKIIQHHITNTIQHLVFFFSKWFFLFFFWCQIFSAFFTVHKWKQEPTVPEKEASIEMTWCILCVCCTGYSKRTWGFKSFQALPKPSFLPLMEPLANTWVAESPIQKKVSKKKAFPSLGGRVSAVNNLDCNLLICWLICGCKESGKLLRHLKMSSGEHHLHPTEHHLQRLKLMKMWCFSIWSPRKIFGSWNPKVLGGFAFFTLHGTQSCKVIWTTPSWLFHVKVLFLLQIKSVDFWGSSRECSKVFYEPKKPTTLHWAEAPEKKTGECPRPAKALPEKKEISDVCFSLSQAICWWCLFFSVKEQHFGGTNKIWMFFCQWKKNTHECDIWPLFQHFSAENMKCRT